MTRQEAEAHAPYDLILCDAPCSGSGTWARNPEAKWTMDQPGLDALCRVQAGILDEVVPLVAHGGTLAYATCSILEAENAAQTHAFLDKNKDFTLDREVAHSPAEGADGMYLAVFRRAE